MNKNIAYELIDSSNYEIAGECLAYMFFHFEPVTSHLGLEWNSYKNMVTNFCRVIRRDGLCFMARDMEKDIAVGVITSVDMKIDFGEKFGAETENFDEVLEKLAPDMAMTAELANDFHSRMNFQQGDCLHLFQCSVLPDYAGQGIANRFVNMTIEKAKEVGYRFAAVSCTGKISRKIFETMNFKTENVIRYSDFEYQGSKFFAGIDGEYVLLSKEI